MYGWNESYILVIFMILVVMVGVDLCGTIANIISCYSSFFLNKLNTLMVLLVFKLTKWFINQKHIIEIIPTKH